MFKPICKRSAARRAGVFAALFVALVAAPSEAATRRVLMLQSLDRGNLTLDFFTGNFRVDLDQGSSDPVTFTQLVVTPPGFEATPEKVMVDYLRALFGDRAKPDLIVTVGGPAAAFARKHRLELFPEVPLLFAAVDERFLEGVPLAENETAVAVRSEISHLIDGILELFPQTSNVFMVVGSGAVSRYWRTELDREFRRFDGRVSFTWSDRLSFRDVLQAVSALPAHSAIFYLTFDTDVQGGAYPEDRVFSDLRAAANAPLFGMLDRQLGHGIVGGRLMLTEQLGHVAADVALRIFQGESPGTIRLPVQKAGPPVFDWRELERWGIGESRLPARSVIRFREPGVWQRYKGVIVTGGSALVAQALLIAGLLVNRRQRQRAERALLDNVADLQVARGTLSNLSGRLMQAQEQERTRLARELHDDIGQRVSFLAIDMARLRDALSGHPEAQSQARRVQEAVIAVGRELQAFSHQLHSAKIDLLGLPAAARALCHEFASRHAVTVEFVHDRVPAKLPDGVAISLFRVLQEALSNVVKHAGAQHCRVTLEGAGDEVRLEVRDDGRGFDAGYAQRGPGLGLISMRERLKLVNGEVVIDSQPGRGTAVRARVPLSEDSEVEAQLAESPAGAVVPPTTV
jgi:signal transduction histidine kinase